MEPHIYAIILYCTNNINTILVLVKNIVLIILNYTNIKIYKIETFDKIKYFKTISKNCISTDRDENNKPSGYIISKNYLAHVTNGDYPTLYLLTTEKTKNKVLNKEEIKVALDTQPIQVIEDEEDKIPENNFKILNRYGSYEFTDYELRNVDFSYFKPHYEQELVISKISYILQTKNRATVFVSGTYGSGKTMMTRLLAKSMRGYLVDDFNPTKPNTFLEPIYQMTNPSKKHPLFIIIDEVDIIIKKIHKGISEHKKLNRMVSDKMDWNTFLDKIDIGLYAHTCVVITSNKTKEEIDVLDPSYLRKGRIHEYIQMGDTKKIN